MTTGGFDPVALHATALVLGEAGVLIRGASGSGKSRLALLLLTEVDKQGGFSRLVGDDRILVGAYAGVAVASPHPAIAGLLERRTQSFGRMPYEPRCVVRLVVELSRPDVPLPRYPDQDRATTDLAGVASVPLLRLQGHPDALSCRFVLEALGMRLAPAGRP